jgi:TM2 domain-containing membrane protein YozV
LEQLKGDSHSVPFGYFIWFLGFTGAHRFYYGKPLTGTLWFCTLGLLGVGWIIDFFLIPSMDRQADLKYKDGPINYNIAWILLVYLGIFGVHRFYMGKWISGIIWLCTGGLFTLGWLYDFWTLNRNISDQNKIMDSGSR